MKDQQKELSIKTVPVTIRVVEVGGKRMTLSVFKQIQDGYFFNTEPEGVVEYLGWVDYSKDRYVLFSDNGNLLKDMYEHIYISKSISDKIKRERWALEMHPDNDLIKDGISKALAELDAETKKCSAANGRYLDLMTPETQIFISI